MCRRAAACVVQGLVSGDALVVLLLGQTSDSQEAAWSATLTSSYPLVRTILVPVA